VQATLIERRRPQLLERAFSRFAARVEMARGGGYFHSPLGGVAPGEERDEHVWRIELMAEPGRFREERRGPDIEHVLVVNGERWWDWSPAFGLRSHEDERGVYHRGGLDLLDPSEFLTGDTTIEPMGEAVVAGRSALRVRVRRSTTKQLALGFGFEPGIEEAMLLLDAERGVVLRRAELVDGEEAFEREIQQIAYDRPLAPESFVFELPTGAAAHGLAESRLMTIDAATAEASFRVLKLGHVPPDWRLRVFYCGRTKLPTLPDSVTLVYTRPDGAQFLQIHQTTEKHRLPSVASHHRIDRGGRSYTALGPEQPAGLEPAELVFAVGETQIRMSSSELSRRQLLEQAEELIEA
jgi:hypothetical protein